MTPEQKGWLLFAIRAQLRKDEKNARRLREKFGSVDPGSANAARLRIGPDVHNWAKGLDCDAARRMLGVQCDTVECYTLVAAKGHLCDECLETRRGPHGADRAPGEVSR